MSHILMLESIWKVFTHMHVFYFTLRHCMHLVIGQTTRPTESKGAKYIARGGLESNH